MILSFENESDVNANNLKKLERYTHEEDTILLNHATWCHHCQTFKPDWDQLKKELPHVNFVEIENTAHQKIGQTNSKLYKRISGPNGQMYFPMIIIFLKNKKRQSSKQLYEGSREIGDLKSYINSKVKLIKSSPKASVKKTPVKNNNFPIDKPYLSLMQFNKELDGIINKIFNKNT